MIKRPARFVLALVIGIVCAVFVFLQSASSVLMPRLPLVAARLMPLNGLALEQAASQTFSSAIKTPDDIVPSAKAALHFARQAFARDPLSPKALAIMAIAEDDAARQSELLERASKLNRRDLMLQGYRLDRLISAGDYAGSLTTIDYILRVHPEQTSTFFPILTDAFRKEAAAMELGNILDGSSDWHENFLEVATGDSLALPNIAKLRLQRAKVKSSIDQRLISGLVRGGDIRTAHAVYLQASDQAARTGTTDRIPSLLRWSSEFPPFDWRFAKDTGFRAQPTIGATALAIFVRSGKGGVLAERLVPATAGPTSLSITHTILPKAQVKDLRLQVSCPEDKQPVLDQPFRIMPLHVALPQLARRCQFMKIAIYGRAWSGRASIKGDISRFEIEAD